MLTNCCRSLTSQTLSVFVPALIISSSCIQYAKDTGAEMESVWLLGLTCQSDKWKSQVGKVRIYQPWNYGLKWFRRWRSNEALKENVASLQSRQNQNSLPCVALQTLWRLLPWLQAHSRGTSSSDHCRLVSLKRPSFGTTVEIERNSWITISIEKSTWGTGYEDKYTCLRGKLSVVIWNQTIYP